MNSTVPKTTAPHNIRTAHPLSSHIGNRGQQDAEYGDCSTDGHVVSVASLEGPSFLVTDRRGDRNNPPTLEVVTTIAVHCRRWINQATVGAFHRGAILFVMTAPSRSSDVPRRLTKSCDQIAAAVNDRDDAEALARQSVDDAIASHDQFSEMGVSVLGNDGPNRGCRRRRSTAPTIRVAVASAYANESRLMNSTSSRRSSLAPTVQRT